MSSPMSNSMLNQFENRTLCNGEPDIDYATGLGAVAIAIVFFGSNFVPVKRFETGDGVFYQWVMCSAVWCVGLIVNAAQGWPKFQPGAMLGGFLWATGNMLAVPVIKMIGLSMGLLIWGSSNMLMGWLTGQLGILGVESQADAVTTPWMNFLGVGLALVSLVLYSQVETNTTGGKESGEGGESSGSDYNRLDDHVEKQDYASISFASPRLVGNELSVDGRGVTTSPDTQKLLDGKLALDEGEEDSSAVQPGSNMIDRLPKAQKRIVGVAGAIVAGLLFGTSFNPVWHIRDQVLYKDDPDCQALNYVFSHFCGIYLTSTCYFLLYCALTKNRPAVYPRVILPGFVSGVMWAIANTAWFVANEKLLFPVSFPLITTGPGFVSMFWGIFLFNEVQGRRNFQILGVAVTIALGAVILIALSQI